MKKTLIIIIPTLFIILVSSVFLALRPEGQPERNINNMPIPTSNHIVIPTRNQLVTGTQNQGQADKNFAEELVRQRGQYPWYSELPILDSSYFVYFDLEKKNFIGKIYSKKNNLREDQIEEIKKEILIKLTSIGVDTTTFSFQWLLM